MGNCLRCGVKYCNCPSDGYCDKCLGIMFGESSGKQITPRQPNETTPNCKYTRKILDNYFNVLTCISKNPASISKLGLTATNVNYYLSYTKSGLNIDSDYCRFSKVLDAVTPIVQNALAQDLCR